MVWIHLKGFVMYKNSSPDSIQDLFSSIASRYDTGNKVISLGMNQKWNEALVAALKPYPVSHLLDLCAGTGDIAFTFLKHHPDSFVTLVDFCDDMLRIADIKGAPYKNQFKTITGDALAIPLEDLSVDGITIAYGIRNVQDPKQCLREMYRVLKPGGVVGILEGTRPQSMFLRLGHRLYLKMLLPLIGKWVSKNKDAYSYLSQSIHTFLAPEKLMESMRDIGFQNIKKKPLFGGATTLLIAEK